MELTHLGSQGGVGEGEVEGDPVQVLCMARPRSLLAQCPTALIRRPYHPRPSLPSSRRATALPKPPAMQYFLTRRWAKPRRAMNMRGPPKSKLSKLSLDSRIVRMAAVRLMMAGMSMPSSVMVEEAA